MIPLTNCLILFVRGLKKSFSGKQYLRELSKCNRCGKPAYSGKICQFCEMKDVYDGKHDRRNNGRSNK